jgi:MoxR-vWA-beta-propeller ternary system domain bpX6
MIDQRPDSHWTSGESMRRKNIDPSNGFFQGTIRADAFVIDVGLLGLDICHARVLSLLTERSVVREIDSARWLLELETPVTVRSSSSPGLPLQRLGGRLVSAPTSSIPEGVGDLCLFFRGEWCFFQTAALAIIDPSTWLTFDDFHLVELRAAEVAKVPTGPAAVLYAVERPDMRKVANLAGRSEQSSELHEAIARFKAERQRHRELLPGRRGLSGPGDAQSNSTSQRRSSAGEQRPIRALFSKFLLRTPASLWFAKKHQKYLRDLENAFDRGDLEEALRNAISIGDAESLGLSLALPSPRNQLQPTLQSPGRTTTVPWGTETRNLLRDRYKKAAARLEAEGRYAEAAFVHVDLLGVPLEAVAMLERHKQFLLAAHIAEGHALDPNLQVTLWWRAGEFQRAVALARRHGAFKAAISLVEQTDPATASQLRAQWVRALTTAGAYRAAVIAGWPDEELRSSLAWAMELGISQGGPDAEVLRAYRLSIDPSDANRVQALELCESTDLELDVQRELFLTTLSVLKITDSAVDREVSSAAFRSILRNGTDWANRARTMKALTAFTLRADRVLAADVPHSPFSSPMLKRVPVHILLDRPAPMQVAEAVALPNGFILAAFGELGVRLLNRNDRVAGQWSVPADHVVVADHGTKALLLSRRGAVVEVHRLDLVTRRCDHWATLRLQRWAETFDGAMWVVVTDDGLEILDTTSDRPVVLWRELSPTDLVVDLQRSPSALTVAIQHELPGPEMWRWDLPSMTLRSRSARVDGQRPLADGTRVAFFPGPEQTMLLRYERPDGHAQLHNESTFHPDTDVVLTSAVSTAVVKAETNQRTAYVYVDSATIHLAKIEFAGTIGIRSVAHQLTVFDQAGQVVVFDLDRLGSFLTRSVRL